MRIYKINEKYLNLNSIKCFYVNSFPNKLGKWIVYADNIEISKSFDNPKEAKELLDDIMNEIKLGYDRR